MKVTKQTGMIGTLCFILGIAVMLGYFYYLLEPLQTAITAGKKTVSFGDTAIAAAIVAIVCSTLWMTATKLIGARKFDLKRIEFKGAFTSKSYWIMNLIAVVLFILFSWFWYNEL